MYKPETSFGPTSISVPGKLLNIILLAAMLNGCATETTKSPDYFAADFDSHIPKINTVALVTDLTPPKIESVELGVTKERAAAGGAVEGALYGVVAGPAFLLLWPAFVAGGVTVGAATSAASGYSADMLTEAEANAQNMLNSGYLQTELLERVLQYGHNHVDLEFIRDPSIDQQYLAEKPDYKSLSSKSIEAVIEVELIRLALKLRDASRSNLIIDARVRLISTHTNAVLSDDTFKFSSPSYTLDEWSVNDAALLTEEIQRGLRRLAEDTVDETFLLFYPNRPEQVHVKQEDEVSDDSHVASMDITRWDMGSPHYVLSPVYSDGLFYRTVEVDGLHPTLQWESFPRDYDHIGANGKLHDITNVRYELRVMTPRPIQQVYNVRDITQPYYKIESGLNSCSKYLWTVRARFKLDGHDRVTEWAGAYTLHGWYRKPWNMRRGLYEDNSPERFFYEIITPCNQEKVVEPHK